MLVNKSSYLEIIVKSIQKEKQFIEKMRSISNELDRLAKKDEDEDEFENNENLIKGMKLLQESKSLYREANNYEIGKGIAMKMAIDKCPNFKFN